MSTLEMFSMFFCGKKNDTDNLRQCERAFCLGRRLKAEIDFRLNIADRERFAWCLLKLKKKTN